ncbi:MAG: RNA-directed DNA polymerase [Saprospiraceae bacterium]|jgi:RNA-directed DNA polymerase
MQLDLFENSVNPQIELHELYEAYFACRKNKRNTINALSFELDYESKLIDLLEEINSRSYNISRSIAFMIQKPVQREIFAAEFRDRIVHHLIIGKLNPLFEKQFIYDSYACREGKGTHFGIQRANRFIRRCTQNYTKDCYILKLDIQGFFMHINKNILHKRLSRFIDEKYHNTNKTLILELCHKVIFNDAAGKCIIKGKSSDWMDLPKSKSLFYSPPNCGLPIGNLSSQIFANFYMDSFDHYIKHDLGIKYYGRYVDDFIIVHEDKSYLKNLISTLGNFLDKELHLTLHPKKIYLQHYSKGVPFLGTIIKPGRIYIGKRTKGNFYQAIQKQNAVVLHSKPTKEEQLRFQSSMNSYLGIMKHYNTYKLRKRMLWKNLSAYWWNHVYLSGGYAKFVLKRKGGK